ncbi:tripartite motif-containing protein 14 [Menidia menidia]
MAGGELPPRRLYWEVEWRGSGATVGVAYGSMARKGGGGGAGLGLNGQSWALQLWDGGAAALHAAGRRGVQSGYSPRLGVFLDAAAGAVAFYGVAAGLTHLHTFRARFTGPLHAAFGVGAAGAPADATATGADTIKICEL